MIHLEFDTKCHAEPGDLAVSAAKPGTCQAFAKADLNARCEPCTQGEGVKGYRYEGFRLEGMLLLPVLPRLIG